MEDCSCVYSCCDDGPRPEFLDVLMRTAAKVHKCTECGRDIVPGEKYENVKGKWDGFFDTFKTCVDCLSVRDAFFCDGYAYGGIWEELWVHFDYIGYEVSSDCLAKLTKPPRDRICDAIEEGWEDCDDED